MGTRYGETVPDVVTLSDDFAGVSLNHAFEGGGSGRCLDFAALTGRGVRSGAAEGDAKSVPHLFNKNPHPRVWQGWGNPVRGLKVASFLINELQSELDKSWGFGRQDLIESWGADVAIRQMEVGVIQDVEQFRAKLQVFGFG